MPPNRSRANHPMALPETLSPTDIDSVSKMAEELAKLHAIATNTVPPPAQGETQTVKTMNDGLKDLVHTADSLKHSMQRARVQIKQMPDMDRTIAQQEEDIRDLEMRIRKQQAVLMALKNSGAEFVVESQVKDA